METNEKVKMTRWVFKHQQAKLAKLAARKNLSLDAMLRLLIDTAK